MGELRPGWRRVKFAQLAECVNDRVDDPSKSGVDRYVGLDHLDPESLTIRRWGAPDEVESTKLRFKPGDIIFGKRRAYQRKLAVADFEGICSAHAMVLRAKPAAVLPEFLPFFMQSDTFMERAVAISVGSLSPTINWKTLAVQEFALPPLEEQRRVAKALQLLDLASSAARTSRDAALVARDAGIGQQMRMTSPGDATLGDLCSVITDGEHATPPRTSAGVYLLSARNIQDDGLDLSNVDYVSPDTFATLARRIAPRWGDVLISCSGSIGRVCPAPRNLSFALVRSVALLRPVPESLNHEFLVVCLQSPRGQQQIRALTNQTAQGNLFQGAIRRIKIPMLPLRSQLGIVDTWKVGSSTIAAVNARIAQLAVLRQRLLGESVGEEK